MTASNGSFILVPSSSESAGFSISGNTASTLETLNANNLAVKSASGDLNIESTAGNVNIKSASTQDIKIIAGTTEGSTDVFGRLLIDGNDVSLTGNGASGTLSLESREDAYLRSTHGILSITASSSKLIQTSNDDLILTAVGNSSNVEATAGDELLLISGNSSSAETGNMSLNAKGGSLTISTTIMGANSEDVDIISAKDFSLATENHIELATTDGAVSISAVTGANNNGGITLNAQHNLTATSNSTCIIGNNASGQTTKITTLGLGSPFTGSNSELELNTDQLDMNAQTLFSLESTGSNTANEVKASGNNATLLVQSSGDLTNKSQAGDVIIEGGGVQLVGSGALGNLLTLEDGSSNELLNVDSSRARLKRTLILGEDVLSNSAVMSGTGSASKMGAGINVTVDVDVEIGQILAVNSSNRFGLAKASRANSGDSELPQNPLGVTVANGSSVGPTSAFMSTVFGAVVLIQLDSVPSAGNLGGVVYLSDTAGKGSINAPAGSSNGLTRVTQIGTLLSTTGSSAQGLSGSITLFPILWNIDYIVDK